MNSKKGKLKPSKKGMRTLKPDSIKSINAGIVKTNSFEATTTIKTKTANKKIVDLDVTTDEVWNPINQQWMKIARKTNSQVSGIIYEITTNSGCVTVTSNHPFMKMDGIILYVAIEGTQVFHNLVFENATDAVNDHFVEANGVVSGVLFLQDKVTQLSKEMVIATA